MSTHCGSACDQNNAYECNDHLLVRVPISMAIVYILSYWMILWLNVDRLTCNRTFCACRTLVHPVPLVYLPPVLVPIPLTLSGFGPNLPTIHPEGQPLGLVKAQPSVPDLPDPYLLTPLQCLQLISFTLPDTTGLSPLTQFTILVTWAYPLESFRPKLTSRISL